MNVLGRSLEEAAVGGFRARRHITWVFSLRHETAGMAVVGIVAQRGNDRAHRLATALTNLIREHGDDPLVDAETGAVVDAPSAPVAAMNECAFVVSIGGDGTFLFVAREAGGVPLVGVNLGEVGFLNAISPPDAIEAVGSLLEELTETGTVGGRTVNRVQAHGDGWSLEPALNEILVHGPKRGPAGGVDLGRCRWRALCLGVDGWGSRRDPDRVDGVQLERGWPARAADPRCTGDYTDVRP